jgi:hypothetical protein
MMDLHDRLAQLAGASGDTSAAQADADVDRGRRALRRRHNVQRMGAAGFATAVLAVAVAYGTTTNGGPASTPGSTPSVVTAKLVAYQGEQPKGFTIDKVPSGWEIQGVSPGALTVAPVGIKDQEPDSFVGKIAIMLQSQDDKSTPTGTAVTVGGKPGVINDGLGTEHGKNLWVKQPNGIWMEVQIWDATGWTQAGIVEFADGIHVLPGAVQGRG